MALLTIRNSCSLVPTCEADLWLARAAQARRIAWSLSRADAALALAHAAECEAEAARLAQRPAQERAPLIAA